MNDTFKIPELEPGLYQHYKGGKYRVLGVGCHTETQEFYVVYAPTDPKLGRPAMWLRPYSMFIETVEINGEVVPRFRNIAE